MKLIIDVNEPTWIERRERDWERLKIGVPESKSRRDKERVRCIRLIFFGESTSLEDPRLQSQEFDYLPDDFLCYSPHQCEENWDSWVPLVIEWKKKKQRLPVSSAISSLVVDQSDREESYAWPKGANRQFFTYLMAEEYLPEAYSFCGEAMSHPLRPAGWRSGILDNLISSLYLAIIGLRSSEDIWLVNYDYCLKAFDYVEHNIFEPRSQLERDSPLIETKISWADAFIAIDKIEEKFFKFESNDRLHPLYKGLTFQQFRVHPNIIYWLDRLDNDLESGRLPSSLKALRQWARAPEVSTIQLRSSTRGNKEYVDPYEPVPTMADAHLEKEAADEKFEDELEPIENVLSIVKKLAAELARLGVAELEGPVNSEQDLRTLLSLCGFKSKRTINEAIREMRECCEAELVISILCKRYCFSLWLEDSFTIDGDPDGGPKYIKEAWTKLRKVIAQHGKLGRLTVREVEIEDDVADPDIEITIKDGAESISYVYAGEERDFDWRELAKNMSNYLRERSFPWELYAIPDEEQGVLIYYLPRGSEALFQSAH